MKKLMQEDLQEGMTSIAEVENIAATVCCSYHVYLHLTMTDYDSEDSDSYTDSDLE